MKQITIKTSTMMAFLKSILVLGIISFFCQDIQAKQNQLQRKYKDVQIGQYLCRIFDDSRPEVFIIGTINTENLTGVEIPNFVEYKNKSYVVNRVTNCFNDNPRIKYVKIEFSGEIENSFNNCDSLETVNLTVSSLNSCFMKCNQLKHIYFTKCIKGLRNCFCECRSIKKVDLPNSLTNIFGSFVGCSSIESIVLPSSLDYIYGGESDYGVCNAFNNCVSLQKIEVRSKEAELGLIGCTNLKNIVFSEGVETIYGLSVKNSPNLNAITISKTVKEISLCEAGEINVILLMGNTKFSSCLADCELDENCLQNVCLIVPMRYINSYKKNCPKAKQIIGKSDEELLSLYKKCISNEKIVISESDTEPKTKNDSQVKDKKKKSKFMNFLNNVLEGK